MTNEPADVATVAERRRFTVRFSRYTALSFLTVPVGYTLLLIAREIWDVNAGLLNLAVGMVLTPPSFFLYRWLVWEGGSGRSIASAARTSAARRSGHMRSRGCARRRS